MIGIFQLQVDRPGHEADQREHDLPDDLHDSFGRSRFLDDQMFRKGRFARWTRIKILLIHIGNFKEIRQGLQFHGFDLFDVRFFQDSRFLFFADPPADIFHDLIDVDVRVGQNEVAHFSSSNSLYNRSGDITIDRVSKTGHRSFPVLTGVSEKYLKNIQV